MILILGILVAAFVAVPVVIGILGILFAVFSGVAVLLIAGVSAGKGILVGAILGFLAYRAFRKNRMAEGTE